MDRKHLILKEPLITRIPNPIWTRIECSIKTLKATQLGTVKPEDLLQSTPNRFKITQKTDLKAPLCQDKTVDNKWEAAMAWFNSRLIVKPMETLMYKQKKCQEEFKHSNREQLTKEQRLVSLTLAEVSKVRVVRTEWTLSSHFRQSHHQTKQLISHKDQICITPVITTIEIIINSQIQLQL